MHPDDKKPPYLTIEDWLLTQNIDWLRKLHVQGGKIVRLKRITLAVLFVVFVLVLALMWQVKVRNQRLDELKATTNRIEVIASEFQQDAADMPESDFNLAIRRGLAQIDALCAQFDCDSQEAP